MLAASSRLDQKTRMNEKDNMLKYQISDDKEENDLREAVLGLEDSKVTSSQVKRIEDGQMISTEQQNKTQIISPEEIWFLGNI